MRLFAGIAATAILIAACGGTAAVSTPSPTASPSPSPTPSPTPANTFKAELKSSNEVPPITGPEATCTGNATVTFTATTAGADKPQGKIIERLLGAHPRISVVGSRKTPAAMAALMARHDIVVIPSNSQYWHETFGIESTPSFFVNGKRLTGEQTVAAFEALFSGAAKPAAAGAEEKAPGEAEAPSGQ